jgi:hypothetical protein
MPEFLGSALPDVLPAPPKNCGDFRVHSPAGSPDVAAPLFKMATKFECSRDEFVWCNVGTPAGSGAKPKQPPTVAEHPATTTANRM